MGQYAFMNSYAPNPAIDPGRMRHPITIRYRAAASPPEINEGGVVLSPVTLYVGVMAAMETVRGTDVIKDGQTTSQLQIAFGMWHRPGIVGGMEVVKGNSTYVIQETDDVDGFGLVLVLICLGLGTNT